jgi:hypothetical protein
MDGKRNPAIALELPPSAAPLSAETLSAIFGGTGSFARTQQFDAPKYL